MQLIINNIYSSLRPYLFEILNTFDTQGIILYNARNQIRMVTTPNGEQLVIKKFKQPKGIKRLIYSFLRMPKAERAYRNALILSQAGFPTPEALGFAINKEILIKDSYLITRSANLHRNFYEFRYHDAMHYEDIIHAFAQLIASMHQKGIYHYDLSPGNILFDKFPDGSIKFSIIDINRMRIGHTISKTKACKNFCRLWGRMDFIEMLGKEYADARGWDSTEVTNLICHYWKQFWHIKTEQDIENLFSRDIIQ